MIGLRADKAVKTAAESADRFIDTATPHVQETLDSVQWSARSLSGAGRSWERAGEIAGTLFAITGAVIILRFVWDVVKDLRNEEF